MQNAPSVSHPVGRCAFQRGLFSGAVLLASLVLITWVFSQGLTWFWFAGGSVTTFGVWQGWHALGQQGVLTWDGQVWCLHDQGEDFEDTLGEITVMWDVQKALLLRWQPASDTLISKPRWLWLGLQSSDQRWQDLRRAVYQRSDM